MARIIFVSVLAFALGFIIFVFEARKYKLYEGSNVPGIVVLTGGENRIAQGLKLLQTNGARRLLISGVNPANNRKKIAAALGVDFDILQCCVDIGTSARNTIENARETALWVKQQKYDEIILVTNDYHMLRALIELEKTLPNTTIISYKVSSDMPYVSVKMAQIWITEYIKYLLVFGNHHFR